MGCDLLRSMRWNELGALVGLLLVLGAIAPARAESARVQEGTLELPTYALGDEDPNPAFALLTRHGIYPYTLLDDLTDRLEKKTYRAIFLENDFLKAIVLPEMGGRVYSLFDKVSGREVFYRNHVVKYGLIAVRGAWISGGLEFNFPDGHTAVTVSPVASATRQNADGSATAIVGDIDQVTGMHWEVALTLRPGAARLEQQVTLFNPTPLSNLYWYWANAAVPATDDMQFIYPMREANPHSRTEIWTYPVWKGVDYSWSKNVRQPTSLFGRQVHRNFFGAYYHQSDYGVVHVADYREVPGKKIWTWGAAGDGLIWTDLLTDHDGPYNEIQSGRYETQLNREFMPPRRVESWTEYWYPVRGLSDGFVEATPRLAVNVHFTPESGMAKQHADVLVAPTEEIQVARVRVKLGPQVLKEFGPVGLKPLEPARFSVAIDDLAAARRALVVDLESPDGALLAHWSAADPVDGNPDFVPLAGAHAPEPKPAEQMTVEELFLRGVDEEKDGQEGPALETYGRALERDPGFIPALLKKAEWEYRSANLVAAEGDVARALARNSFDPAVHYAAGVIYRSTGRLTLASDAFWASVRYGGPPAPALAQLGELAIREKRYSEAARLLRESLSYNRDDALALADLSVALRLDGKTDEAAKAADAALQKMPLLPLGAAEAWRARQAGNAATSFPGAPGEAWKSSFARDAQNYLEVAAWYVGLGDWLAASDVLQAARQSFPPPAGSPLVDYYLASVTRRLGQEAHADSFVTGAGSLPYQKVFPSRLADVQVLGEIVMRHPLDAHALYEFGNFLFARGRYDDAARLWLQALGEGADDAALERNLGVFAWRVKRDLKGAGAYYSKALQLAPNDYRLYRDLDEIYFESGDTSNQVKLFAGAPAAVLERDTIRVRRALLDIEQKQFDRGLEMLRDHRFKPWEGGEVVREIYVLAQVERGKQQLQAGHAAQAESAFRAALEYPPNLGVGKPDRPRDGEPLYWLGEALKAQGKIEQARAAWQQAAEGAKAPERPPRLYAALALRQLGRGVEADEILNDLVKAAGQERAGPWQLYIGGLAERARNNHEAARRDFSRALELDPSFWQARLKNAE